MKWNLKLITEPSELWKVSSSSAICDVKPDLITKNELEVLSQNAWEVRCLWL